MNDYAAVNPHNFRPVFSNHQLAASVRATILYAPLLRTVTILDIDSLHSDILSALPEDPIASAHIAHPEGRWSLDQAGYLRMDNRMYVPEVNNLRVWVLQSKHDHILSGHFSQNKTLELVCQDYTWPRICDNVKNFCKSCVTCMHSKPQCH